MLDGWGSGSSRRNIQGYVTDPATHIMDALPDLVVGTAREISFTVRAFLWQGLKICAKDEMARCVTFSLELAS